jgi:hypothetical protein
MNYRHVSHDPVRAVSGEQRHPLAFAKLCLEPGGHAIYLCDRLTPSVLVCSSFVEVSHPNFFGLCTRPMTGLFSESAAFHVLVTYWRS